LTRYSICKVGSEYVVLAGDKHILKVASRRRAARLVVEAAELLSEQSPPVSERGHLQDQSPVIPAKFLDDSGRFP